MSENKKSFYDPLSWLFMLLVRGARIVKLCFLQPWRFLRVSSLCELTSAGLYGIYCHVCVSFLADDSSGLFYNIERNWFPSQTCLSIDIRRYLSVRVAVCVCIVFAATIAAVQYMLSCSCCGACNCCTIVAMAMRFIAMATTLLPWHLPLCVNLPVSAFNLLCLVSHDAVCWLNVIVLIGVAAWSTGT